MVASECLLHTNMEEANSHVGHVHKHGGIGFFVFLSSWQLLPYAASPGLQCAA
jgi:hypothetical protein